MNEPLIRPGGVAAAAVTLGGFGVIALPQHAATLVQLVLITVPAAIALFALSISVPEWGGVRWLLSPFKRPSRTGATGWGTDELDRIRGDLSRRRQPIPDGTPLTPGALRVLQPLVRAALERNGLNPDHREDLEVARKRVAPLTWAVLISEPLLWKNWYETLRPDEAQVAEVVHRVLDDLDRLSFDATGVPSPTPEPPRTPPD